MERLEVAHEELGSCQLCRAAIVPGTLAIRFQDRRLHDAVSAYHASCAAVRRPSNMLVALADRPSSPTADLLHAIATTMRVNQLVRVIWRHANGVACLVELAEDRYALFATSGTTPIAMIGTLDEALATVPDTHLEAAVDAAVAAGKAIGRRG
jgi:hypothetical protein